MMSLCRPQPMPLYRPVVSPRDDAVVAEVGLRRRRTPPAPPYRRPCFRLPARRRGRRSCPSPTGRGTVRRAGRESAGRTRGTAGVRLEEGALVLDDVAHGGPPEISGGLGTTIYHPTGWSRFSRSPLPVETFAALPRCARPSRVGYPAYHTTRGKEKPFTCRNTANWLAGPPSGGRNRHDADPAISRDSAEYNRLARIPRAAGGHESVAKLAAVCRLIFPCSGRRLGFPAAILRISHA